MKLNLENLNAYELRQQRPLTDIHSDGLLFVHKKSGARVCVVSNDDENKVFYIGFRTPPKDSTGVAHIIEHTVLCGSEKFPVKDPFIELAKGSMNTFLNAMTYPDKTMYPVASCNDKDFQNLMDVYMDAVLHPNIFQEENIFKQEGWHYELENAEAPITLNGVVYNEMKGAFSSADGVLEREILNSLFPDTTYQYESGGDPEVIPELTYEDYLNFHRTYYHPSNSYIYLYGNMDVEEKLNWLDEAYLSAYDRLDVDSEIPMQTPFDEPLQVDRYYSISSAQKEEKQTYLSCNWAVGDVLDREQYLAYEVLDYALLSSQGAPIKQALLDEGIGSDIYGGYDSGIRQPMFSIIVKNADAKDQERFLEIIRKVLEEQVEHGISQKTLLAAINGSEFKFREADFGRFPKGLMFGLQLMDSWLYDDEQPFLHMDALEVYASLREKISTGYFEELVRTGLLENRHKSYVRIMPQKGLTAAKEKALQQKLEDYKMSLSDAQIEALIRQTKALAEYQEAPSSREALDTIPLLGRSDMKQVSDPYSNVVEEVDQIPMIWHDYETNGILYLELMFDVHHISEELIPYMGILKYLLGKMDTVAYTFTDLADEINLYTGGISNDVSAYARVDQKDAYEAKFSIQLKTLQMNLDKALHLAKSILLETQFTDEKRLYEILAQVKSRLQSELSESGHTISANRALSYFSARSRYMDLLHGISQYRVLERIVSDFEQEKADLITKLNQLTAQIFQRSGLLISCTGSREGFDLVRERISQITDNLYPDTVRESVDVSFGDQKNEGFMDASQIQYVSCAGTYLGEGDAYTGVLRIFKTIMSYEYLWQNVRVRGGAYGCMCNVARTGELCFSSYRDPNLSRTLEVYRGVADYLKKFDADDRDMTRFIIGTFSEMDAPLTPVSRGRRSLLAWLTGLTYEMIQKDREAVLAADQESIRNLAGYVQNMLDTSYICAIGNEEKITEEKHLFAQTEHLVQK